MTKYGDFWETQGWIQTAVTHREVGRLSSAQFYEKIQDFRENIAEFLI